jgi:hypothetical protein
MGKSRSYNYLLFLHGRSLNVNLLMHTAILLSRYLTDASIDHPGGLIRNKCHEFRYAREETKTQ